VGDQAKWGIEMYKYGTVYLAEEGRFDSMRYCSNIPLPNDNKYLSFYYKQPVKGLKLALPIFTMPLIMIF